MYNSGSVQYVRQPSLLIMASSGFYHLDFNQGKWSTESLS